MSKRSPLKHFPLFVEDLNACYSATLGLTPPSSSTSVIQTRRHFSSRNLTISNLNFRTTKSVYQGKVFVYFNPSDYHVGFKLGSFTKTRKPFFFRSKKKKK